MGGRGERGREIFLHLPIPSQLANLSSFSFLILRLWTCSPCIDAHPTVLVAKLCRNVIMLIISLERLPWMVVGIVNRSVPIEA